MTIGSRRVLREEATAVLAGRLESLPKNIREKTRIPLGSFQGLRFGMILDPRWAPEVYLEGKITRIDTLSREHHGPRAVLNALDRLAKSYVDESARIKQNLSIAKSQLRDYQVCLDKAFPHDSSLSHLTELRD